MFCFCGLSVLGAQSDLPEPVLLPSVDASVERPGGRVPGLSACTTSGDLSCLEVQL